MQREELQEECNALKLKIMQAEKILDEERQKFEDLQARYTEQTTSMETLDHEKATLESQIKQNHNSEIELNAKICDLEQKLQQMSGDSQEVTSSVFS